MPIGKKSVSMLVPCACVRSCQRVLRACMGVSEREGERERKRERERGGGERETDRQTDTQKQREHGFLKYSI